MSTILNIQVLETNATPATEIALEIPALNLQNKIDSYYFALAIEPNCGIKAQKNAVAQLLKSWINAVQNAAMGSEIYLPIDFQDQGTCCIKVVKTEVLTLCYGCTSREGWSIDVLTPDDFYYSITDFLPTNKATTTVNHTEFEACLLSNIKRLETS